MTEQLFRDVFDEELAKDAIINDRHTGHSFDYLLLHCLIRKYKPNSFFECGTNTGFGTLIICNAMGEGKKVYSLDLLSDRAGESKQHPISEGKGDVVGHECTEPYTQLFGDSRKFNYWDYPCEGYFVDTDHDRNHVFMETCLIILEKPNIIIFHDSDIPEVYKAIGDAMVDEPYDLFRVTDTRILYAIKQTV